MSTAAQNPPIESAGDSGASPASGVDAWKALRGDEDLQFAPVEIPEIKPPEPSWFERMLAEVFGFLAEIFAPVGQVLGASWWWLQWVLLAALVAFVIVLLWRMFGPGAARRRTAAAELEEEWHPETAASLALLEDADRLAAEGRYD